MIEKDFIPEGRENRPGEIMHPSYITIHDTGNKSAGADARSHARYLKGDKAESLPVSWHFTVDDSIVVQHLPLDESAWHAGDGSKGEGNRNSIGIEICKNVDGDRRAAEVLAAKLVVKLINEVESLKEYPGCMKQHWDWNQKDCPGYLRSGKVLEWNEWLHLIYEKMNVQVPEWKIKPVKNLAERGLLNDPDRWIESINDPPPFWAVAILIERVLSEGVDSGGRGSSYPTHRNT